MVLLEEWSPPLKKISSFSRRRQNPAYSPVSFSFLTHREVYFFPFTIHRNAIVAQVIHYENMGRIRFAKTL